MFVLQKKDVMAMLLCGRVLMENIFNYRTGIDITSVELINYARNCMEIEMEYERGNSTNRIQKNIPPFTKVLYRYFAR